MYRLSTLVELIYVVRDEQTVFVYRPKQETAVFDEPDALIPVPSFASDLQLTVKDLFAWLLN